MKIYIIFAFLVAVLIGCDDATEKKSNVTSGKVVVGAAAEISKSVPISPTDYSDVQLGLLDVSEREFGDVNSLALLFNAPLDPDQKFLSFISVDPPAGEPVLSNDGRTLNFTPVTPESAYRVSLSPGLKARNKTTLKTQGYYEITTRASPANVSFEVDGAVITPGDDLGLPVLAVNVPEADVNVYRVKDERVQDFFLNYKFITKSSAYLYKNEHRAERLTHIYTTRVQTGVARNTRNRVRIPLTALGDISKPGIYFATITEPGGFEFSSATWFSVSSIGLQLREYKDYTRITAQHLKTGELLSDVNIKALTKTGEIWAKGRTNINGFLQLDKSPKNQSQTYIVAQKGREVSVLPYSGPTFDLSQFDVGKRPYRDIEVFTYSPRNIYRPGETVVISALKRNADGQTVGGALNVKILTPDGAEQQLVSVQPQAGGYFEFEYDLSVGSPLGIWQAVVFDPANATNEHKFEFKVEEFLPERLRLVFNEGKREITAFSANTKAEIVVRGEYLYGAPASGNNLDTVAKVLPWSMPFQHLKGFRFGDLKKVVNETFKYDGLQLDENGEATTIIDGSVYNWLNLNTIARVRLGYSLYETGGRAVTRYKNVLFWPSESFVGVKPHFGDNRSSSKTDVGFDLVRANSDGYALASGSAKIELIREETQYFWSFTRSRGWHYQTERKEYKVSSQVKNFTTKDPISIKLPVDWGAYRLEVTDLKAKSKTVYPFHAGEPWYNTWKGADKNIRPDRVTIALDKKAYLPGQTVNLKIAAPTNGIALVMLEAGQVLYSTKTTLTDKKAELSFDVPNDLARHDAYISVFVVAPSGAVNKIKKRSFGVVPIYIDRSSKQLYVALEVPEKWFPEQQVLVKVKISTADNKPPNGEMHLTLSAVDSGALSLTGYKVIDPHKFFYGQRRYSVRLSDMYDDVLEPTLVNDATVRWGGDADLMRGGDKPVTDVRIVSLFSGQVIVKNGAAEIPLDLPVFDGELTLTAVAFGRDSFGLDTQTVKVAAPVIAQISMPRFLAYGDTASIALDLINLSGADGTAELSFHADGALTSDGVNKKVSLKDGQKKVSAINVTAQAIGAGNIVASVEMGEAEINRRWTLGVRASGPAHFSRRTVVLQPGEIMQMPTSELSSFFEQTIKLRLRVGLTPDLWAGEHFDYLRAYPYGCLEQTTSKSKPFALLPSEAERSRMGLLITNEEIKSKVTEALARYTELQQPSGGFGLWNKQSAEEKWLTAYTTEYLMDLKVAGFTVPESMLNKAITRLKQYVKSPAGAAGKTLDRQTAHYKAAYRAYAAFVLSKAGKITLGPVLDIVDRDLNLAKGPLPGVHLGLAMIALGDVENGVDLVKKSMIRERPEGYFGDYGSALRDRTMAVEHVLANERLPNSLRAGAYEMVLSLSEDMKSEYLLSTQERTTLFKLAIILATQQTGKTWSGNLQVADRNVALNAQGEYGKSIAFKSLGDAVTFTNTSDQTLYGAFSWSGVAKKPTIGVENGIRVRTKSYLVQGKEIELLALNPTLKTGDVVLNEVTLHGDKPIRDALLVHLLPAGLELENQNLTNSLKLEDITIDGRKLEQNKIIKHEEFREDRYVAAMELSDSGSFMVYFLMRAVNPGNYVAPVTLVESMYTPTLNGTGNTLGRVTIHR